MMNLLYVWNEAYSGGKENRGYLLSGRYEIVFDRSGNQLSIQRREDAFADEFWGGHICDVMAVAGRNGAGKTRLAYLIMDTLSEALICKENTSGPRQNHADFLLVFEAGNRKDADIKIFATDSELSVGTPLKYDLNLMWRDLECFKFAYFTDMLSLEDYRYRKYGIVHDGSLGGCIQKYFKHNLEMHYTNSQRDRILNYFDDEMGKILDFVCFDQNQEGIPFVLPKRVEFSLVGFTVNLDYILDELRRMGKPDEKGILRRKCDEIQETYGRNMSSSLSIHLMLNLFKESCIPQTSADHLEDTAEIFLKEIERLEGRYEDAYDMVLGLLDAIRPAGKPYIIEPYENMLRWLKEEADFPRDQWGEMWTLDLTRERETVRKLYDHYRKTNFPYPYFSISFGLSTGEYAFLRRFVQINELLSRDYEGHACVMNNFGIGKKCDSLMLYFDEADHSLHPEWQRKYLDWLLQFVSARFKTCTVQLVIATHSPVMLSDIPSDHVLYLWNNGREIRAEKRDVRTFGSNIHNLFRDAFFMEEGTMGAFAERKINEIAHELQDSGGQISSMTRKMIEEIGDDVIRGKLQQMCRINRSRETVQTEDRTIEETIRLLRNQVTRLEDAIKELERRRYDKD